MSYDPLSHFRYNTGDRSAKVGHEIKRALWWVLIVWARRLNYHRSVSHSRSAASACEADFITNRRRNLFALAHAAANVSLHWRPRTGRGTKTKQTRRSPNIDETDITWYHGNFSNVRNVMLWDQHDEDEMSMSSSGDTAFQLIDR